MTATRSRAVDLFLLGFLTLFLELALIRYLAGNIWNLGYFPNLVLMATFVGMGLGFLFHHRVSDRVSAILFYSAPFALLTLFAFVSFGHLGVPGFGRWSADIGGELFFTAVPEGHETDDGGRLAFAVWFGLTVLTFALISQRTGRLFRSFRPLHAYTLDISGSCLGIVAFMGISALQIPAYAWFLAVVPVFLRTAPANDAPRLRWLPLAPLALVVFLAQYQDSSFLAAPSSLSEVIVRWSPYQKIELEKHPRPPHTIYANGIYHQQPASAKQIQGSYFDKPYQLRERRGAAPYESALIIGAGSGNDVTNALRNGVDHVDAIEIDPAIAAIGQQHHPARPYDDPRVNLVIDDGRAFMERTQRSYDLVIFALTDSVVKISPMAQLRLENYLFTRESFARAYELLNDRGDLVFYNFYRHEWLQDKLRETARAATGKPAKRVHTRRDLSVNMVTKDAQAGPPGGPTQIDIPTDDWPFLYLERRGIPRLYVIALAVVAAFVVLVTVLVQRQSIMPGGAGAGLATKLAFMLMGVAFLLLETKSVIQFSLLFGTTWKNNSLVFLGVLLLVLAANWVAARTGWIRLAPLYAVLLASCLVSLWYPLANLLAIESPAVRFLAAALVTFSPIFFANLMFSIAFRDIEVAEHVFGWNLLGATLGGLVEYSSMALGYTALAGIVAAAYTLVYVLLIVGRRSDASRERKTAGT